MAIVDDAHEIRQRLHRIKADEALLASGEELDRLGSGYSLGRQAGESDADYKHRVWIQIMKVMLHAGITEIERRRTEEDAATAGTLPPATSG